MQGPKNMPHLRTIILTVTAKVEVADDEDPIEHRDGLCNVIKGIPAVTRIQVEREYYDDGNGVVVEEIEDKTTPIEW